MKNTWIVPLLATSFWGVSCQENGTSEDFQEKEHSVFITAKIGKPVLEARYVQSTEKASANFSPNDCIGVFMDGTLAGFTMNSSAWVTSSEDFFWPDREEEHMFHAFYPYTDATADATTELVPMPSLKGQDGTWENLSQFDFLVATKTLAYQDDAGKVAFSGENAFKHVSSLLKINLKAEGDLANATITKITLQGENLVTSTSYSFTTGNVTTDRKEESALTIEPGLQMDDADAPFYFIVNGEKEAADETSSAVRPIDLSIEYTCNGKNYIANREEFANSLLFGHLHSYDIIIKGGNVIITGGEISGWATGETETIIINGEEVPSTNE